MHRPCFVCFAIFVFTLLAVGKTLAADFTVRTVNDEFAYTINGTGNTPPLTLTRGQTYTFDISTCFCHPFEILGAPPGSVVNNNISSGTLVFTVPAGAVNYSYQCSVHHFGNTINTVGPASPPAAATNAATNVGSTAATLKASVTPNGAPTTASFTYGTDPTLTTGTTTTATQNVGNGASATPVSITLSGLQPVTTYYFQVTASNSAGSVSGDILSFTTLSNDSSLSALAIDQGGFTPGFDPATFTYADTVPNGTISVTVTPTASQANASIKVNNVATASGSASTPVQLGPGVTHIPVLVTAQDGVHTSTYTIDVTINAPHIAIEQPMGTSLPFAGAARDFGTLLPGAMASKDFTIRSIGNEDLDNVNVTIDGADAADFSVAVFPASTVAVNNSTTFTVQFAPATIGAKSAVLHVTSNAANESPFNIQLTGTANRAVSFAQSSQQQIEGNVTVTVPVNLSEAFNTGFTVPVTVVETPALNDFTASVSPSVPLTFAASQTQASITLKLKDNAVISGNRAITLTLGQPSNAAISPGSQATFTLNILEDDVLPSIQQQPASQIIETGQPVTFTASANGSPPLAYQWKKNGLPITGATTTSLTLPAVALSDAGAYLMTAANHHPAVPSTAAQLAVVDRTSHIVRANPHAAPTMTVTATGNFLKYQWKLNNTTLVNGSKYAGVTTKTLTVKNAVSTDQGPFVCTVTAPGGSLDGSPFTLEVPTSAPVPLNPDFPPCVAYNAYSYQLPFDDTASEAPTKFVCSGLPLGLTCNTLTGLVSGKPLKTGTFTVKVTVSNAVGAAAPVTGSLVVSAFPPGAVGSYVGLIGRDSGLNASLGGRIDLTTTATGSFTGALRLGGAAYVLKNAMVTAPSAGAHPGITLNIPRVGKPAVVLALDLDPVTFALGGSVQVSGGMPALSIAGWRNTWHSAAPANLVAAQLGSHSFELEPDAGGIGNPALPQGFGYGTLTVTSIGGATVSGHTSDGAAVLTSGSLSPQGEALVYQVLYTNRGSVFGKLTIATDASHTLSGTLDWQKTATTTAREYAPFGPVNIGASGGLYVASKPILGLPVTAGNNARLVFTDGGIAGSATNPSLTLRIGSDNRAILPQPNPGKITALPLVLTTTTGSFSGRFTLTDPVAILRTVSFQGQLVSPLGKGYGYFLLPQLQPSLKTSPILSGQVVLEAIPPTP